MADTPGAVMDSPTTIVNTPPPAAPPTPESKLFATTPNGEPKAPATEPVAPAAAAAPPATPPSTTPSQEPPKAPTDATKPGDAKSPTTPPTDYTLVLPEGSLLSTDDLAAIAKEAKDAGLTKEEAEEVLKSHNAVATQTAQRIKAQQDSALKEQVKLWRDSVEKDPEIGGDKFNETVALASRAFKSVASPTLQKLADETGLGSHPEFVRMMAKVGRLIGEDRLVLGNVGAAPATRDPASVLYGKTTPDGSGRKTAA